LSKHLHIVSFSIPFPANYGGVIDVFCKVKSLYKSGIEITLHCFKYDREEAEELYKYCKEVIYYDRKMKGFQLFSKLPFIVSSRSSQLLLSNLLKDHDPILFEGLHTCALIDNPKLINRKKLLRSHNIEHHYYAQLAKIEPKYLKRFYFKLEARKLEKFERLAMTAANHILGISKKDCKYLGESYKKTIHVSAFHAYETVEIPTSTEPFAFYHGNLEVGENNEAALFLVNSVFSVINFPLVIAGNEPSRDLEKACEQNSNITLKGNTSSEEIETLLRTAHINVLPTFQSTGIKLKLLSALFLGNHCLVNEPMILGTGLESLVEIANSPEEFMIQINRLKEVNQIKSEANRVSILEPFTNQAVVSKVIDLLNEV
jgi:hypothetical protein